MGKCTVNMINFVRGVEPRYEADLLTPVKEQVKLNRKYGVKSTFLIQYDAYTKPEFSCVLKSAEDSNTELGLWIEMARPLIEKLGYRWNGRPGYDWDSHVNPGFLMAYTREQRVKIIDELMSEFKKVFGHYPTAVGSWMIDSFSMKYMAEHYPVTAYAICREQCGTDGYTLWGGYYNQGYYPSVHNMLCPAQNPENQIDIPTFRMLGFDQLHGYERHQQSCITMEPVWEWGKNPVWVDWYMKNLTDNEDLGFSYVQIGQENSFGWENYGEALEMQIKKIKELEKEGKAVFEQLSETGRKYREKYRISPPLVLSAYGDYNGNDDSAVWYQCKNYRFGLMNENGRVYIRDIHLFDESYKEEFEDGVCTGDSCTYDTLPVVDGYAWDATEHRGGLYFDFKGHILSHKKQGDAILINISVEGGYSAEIRLNEEKITVCADCKYSLYAVCDATVKERLCGELSGVISMRHNGFDYSTKLENGVLTDGILKPDENNTVILKL